MTFICQDKVRTRLNVVTDEQVPCLLNLFSGLLTSLAFAWTDSDRDFNQTASRKLAWIRMHVLTRTMQGQIPDAFA